MLLSFPISRISFLRRLLIVSLLLFLVSGIPTAQAQMSSPPNGSPFQSSTLQPNAFNTSFTQSNGTFGTGLGNYTVFSNSLSLGGSISTTSVIGAPTSLGNFTLGSPGTLNGIPLIQPPRLNPVPPVNPFTIPGLSPVGGQSIQTPDRINSALSPIGPNETSNVNANPYQIGRTSPYASPGLGQPNPSVAPNLRNIIPRSGFQNLGVGASAQTQTPAALRGR